ncbi:MAG: polyprenyl synthetase family protein [Bacteroidota bacterium]
MQETDHYRKGIESAIERLKETHSGTIYNPAHYILSLPAKRLRPILTLIASDMFDGELKGTENAALAVEIFHNFSLVHDDVMDEAPLRRGEQTVHKKWNLNTAILSGDMMLVMAYDQIMKTPEISRLRAFNIFSKTAADVCIGQQMDMEFEQRWDVSLEEYVEMIKLKTSVLLASSLQLGALCAGANEYSTERLHEFGLEIGWAFQIQDDYLDLFGNTESLGKQKGGDIYAKKKTILLLKALELGNNAQKDRIAQIFKGEVTSETINELENMMRSLKVPEAISELKNEHMTKAKSALDDAGGNKSIRELLWRLSLTLIDREF